VIVFAYLTMQVVWTRAINPVEAAAADVAAVELDLDQQGPSEVQTLPPGEPTPTLIPTSEAREADQRTNILVMGIDRRPGESFISRTDSMMLVSIDPVGEQASILSIPRDLYAMIPGFGKDRINTAFVYGSAGDNPVAGAALAMSTIEYNFGVPVDHYVLVDFSAVIKGIDTLGGVTLNVPFDINDPTYPDMNYGYDPLFIPAGTQQMDGRTALKYARTRHVDNDFGRAARQQQVLLAARDKAMGLGIAGLLARAPELYKRVEQGIRTDLSLEQLVQLTQAASSIDSERIHNEVLDGNYVSPFLTEKGAQVLVLDPDATTQLVQELFYDE
jgi:LCP family protein required for cell wall assembly